jgi:hypothetical protein
VGHAVGMDSGDRHAGNDNEDAILARAIGDLGIAVTGETVVWEEALTVDTPLSAAAERVHAVLAATSHSLLPGLPATSDDQHQISWVAGRGGVGGELSPVLITVRLTVEEHGIVNTDRTAIKIRGAAREEKTIKPWSDARTAVDMLMGILGDLFDDYDIVDITGLHQHWHHGAVGSRRTVLTAADDHRDGRTPRQGTYQRLVLSKRGFQNAL